MATDIKLNLLHDLDLSTGDLQLFTQIEDLTVQMVKIRLQTFKGEWFRDIDIGVPYLQEIFGKRGTAPAADANIKNTILATDNIQSITSYSSSVNPLTRTFSVGFSAVTDNGEILSDIELEI